MTLSRISLLNHHCLVFLLWLTCQPTTEAQSIRIDEDFSDWISTIDTWEDAGDISSLDIESLSIAHNDVHIYLKIKLDRPILLQESNDLRLLMFGTNWNLNYTFGYRRGFLQVGSQNSEVYHSDIGLIYSPTVSSSEFEIKIDRTVKNGQADFFLGDKVDIRLIHLTDRLPNNGNISYDMGVSVPLEIPYYDLSRAEGSDFRMMSWNVLRDNIFESQLRVPYSSIIRAMNPDVIAFQEIYDHSSSQVLTRLTNVFDALDPTAQWFSSKRGNDIILISKYPFKYSREIAGNGVFVIDRNGQDILIINAHLPCCENDNDREREIDALLSFIRDARDGLENYLLKENTPIIITGDMNFVGNANQIAAFVNGNIFNETFNGEDFYPDWDESPLADLRPYTTGHNTVFTWKNDFSSYAPGRLDLTFFSDYSLESLNSYVLDTDALTSSELSQYNLERDYTARASDHLPLIVDFKIKDEVSTLDLTEDPVLVYPNPSHDAIHVSIDEGQINTMRLYDSQGRLKMYSQSPSLDVSSILSGLYIVEVITSKGAYRKSIVVSR